MQPGNARCLAAAALTGLRGQAATGTGASFIR
jgi:hypothetical protein